MKLKSFLLATLLLAMSAKADNKISYFESDPKYHDDFVLVTLQSGDYRSFKLCNRFLYKAGTLDHSNPEHCSQVGKSAYKYLNSSLIAYKSKAREEAASASRNSSLGWSAMWTSIALPTGRVVWQALGKYITMPNEFSTSISANRYWLITGSILAVVTGYAGSIQGEIQKNLEMKIKALDPATSPIMSGSSVTIDMKVGDYSKLLNEVLIQLETEGLISGQNL